MVKDLARADFEAMSTEGRMRCSAIALCAVELFPIQRSVKSDVQAVCLSYCRE